MNYRSAIRTGMEFTSCDWVFGLGIQFYDGWLVSFSFGPLHFWVESA